MLHRARFLACCMTAAMMSALLPLTAAVCTNQMGEFEIHQKYTPRATAGVILSPRAAEPDRLEDRHRNISALAKPPALLTVSSPFPCKLWSAGSEWQCDWRLHRIVLTEGDVAHS